MIRMGLVPRVFVYEYLSGGGRGRDAQYGDDPELLVQGCAMRNALVRDLAAIDRIMTTYATTASDPFDPGSARTVASRPEQDERAASFLRRHAQRHDRVWVIAPETDGILANLRQSVGDPNWIGCSADAIRIASSKRATAECLRRGGVPTTCGCDGADMRERRGRRWVVKPDDGAGAYDTRVHRTLREAQADRASREARDSLATLERWEEGEPLSLSVLCSAGAVEVLSINRQCIEVDGAGRVQYRGVVVNSPVSDVDRTKLKRLAHDVTRALPGLVGYVGIDVVLRADGHPVVIEVNPRLTSAYVGLSASLGRNIARDVLERLGIIEPPVDA
jgi:predicted ATP-grasp superfamily ATP-dependent carboligase